MLRALVVVLALAALLCGGSALADPLSGRFPTLTGMLNARLGSFPTAGLTKAEKRQKVLVAKAVKALTSDAGDDADALKFAKKAVKATHAAYPDDVDLAPELDAMVQALGDDIVGRGARLFTSVNAMPDGSSKTKAQKYAVAAEAHMVSAFGVADRLERLGFLAAADKSLALGEKVVRKAGGGGSSLETAFDADVGAEHMRLPPASGDYVYRVSYDAPSDAFVLVARGTIGAITHTISLRIEGPGVGTRNITPNPQNIYTRSDVVGAFNVMPSSIEFTTWDPAGGRVAGRFDVTFVGAMTQVPVTNATFSSTSLLR